jgi:tripartite-type tricarboxylate transporter receptor subunit TctC
MAGTFMKMPMLRLERERRNKRLPRVLLAALVLTALAPVVRARAQDAAEFYRSHDVSIVVGTTPGGTYDLMARFLAPHLARHIPGNPRVIVRNMPGAGSIVAANYIWKTAPADGTMIAALLNNVAFEPLFGTAEAVYDPLKLNWIGSSNAETAFLAVWHDVPVTTLADARAREIRVGASAVTSAPTFFARLLNATLGTKLKVIAGYPGSQDAFLAMQRGELDGYGSFFTSDLNASKQAMIHDGRLRLIVQYGPQPEPDYLDVPFAPDQVTAPDARALMQAGFALLAVGRPYAMSPDVPPDRLAAVRRAFADMIRDPGVVEEGNRLGLRVDRGQTGDRLTDIIAAAYATPPRVVESLRRLKME